MKSLRVHPKHLISLTLVVMVSLLALLTYLWGSMASGALAKASTPLITNRVPTPTVSSVTYTVTDLGTLDGTSSSARGINNLGQVVGYSENRAFIWQNGVMTNLGTLGASEAHDINDTGQVVGLASAIDSGDYHAFIWQNGVMTDLGTLGGPASEAYSINNSGQVVGLTNTLVDSEYHPFIWQNGVMTNLEIFGGSGGGQGASDINNSGQVVGDAIIPNTADSHAFIWANGAITDI